jgi:hypothetical protein
MSYSCVEKKHRGNEPVAEDVNGHDADLGGGERVGREPFLDLGDGDIPRDLHERNMRQLTLPIAQERPDTRCRDGRRASPPRP